mmetsp:Transcript_61079/g.186409  ORF Transcript_61079/g.186409 Transcript_61079/m.186409 type:complete len:234 (+) Transcript_61079:1677-2378(+)
MSGSVATRSASVACGTTSTSAPTQTRPMPARPYTKRSKAWSTAYAASRARTATSASLQAARPRLTVRRGTPRIPCFGCSGSGRQIRSSTPIAFWLRRSEATCATARASTTASPAGSTPRSPGQRRRGLGAPEPREQCAWWHHPIVGRRRAASAYFRQPQYIGRSFAEGQGTQFPLATAHWGCTYQFISFRTAGSCSVAVQHVRADAAWQLASAVRPVPMRAAAIPAVRPAPRR